MADAPYTTADEDPFNVRPYVEHVQAARTIKHRRSSMLDKWISEQHAQSSNCPDSDALHLSAAYFSSSGASAFASASNPYLAYPDLPRVPSENTGANDEETTSIHSYDLVDDDDIPDGTILQEPFQQVPVTPMPQRTHKSSRSSITPSFRNLNLNFRSNSPAGPSSPNMETASRAFARLSFFPRTPRSSTGPSSEIAAPQQHARSSSLSTLTFSASHQPTKVFPASTSKWRPSVLGHFQQSSTSQVSVETSEVQYTPPRPSISSGETYTTWNTSRTTTTLDSNIPTTPSKLSLFDSIRLRSNKSPKTLSRISVASTSSVRLSGPHTAGIIEEGSRHGTDHPKGSVSQQRVPFAPMPGSSLDNLDNEDDLDPPPTYRFNKHESSRPPIPYSSSGTLTRVKFSSLNSRTHRKKKKLIISGIGVAEVRKFEGVKRWCESFGDVRQITRMPNGDLQVDFRDPEVADTVCRVRAKVFIAGVGSVQLSWISGNKR